MTYIKKIVLSICLISTFSMMGQDIHFSQFYMSPLNLNPAMTGVMNCKNRFVANYRNQWASVLQSNAYNTYSASFDQKNAIGRDDYFGIGATLWGDVAGESRFGTNQARFSFSYSKKMAGKRKKSSYLVFGADAGVSQRKISQADLRWPSQITGDGFDITLPGETINDDSKIYGDLSAGLLWFTNIDENNSYYGGVAMHHLNKPNVSFLGQTVSLYNRITIHGGGEFEVRPNISILPFGIVMLQGPHREFNGGASARFNFGNVRTSSQSWDFGLYYRLGIQDKNGPTESGVGLHSDAVIFQTKFNLEQMAIGFSYDLNVSKLSTGGAGNGSFELALQYNICAPENRGVYCPRF